MDEHSCLFHVGADSPRGLDFLLGALEVDFDIDPSSELGEHVAGIADRFRRALGR